VELPKSHTPSLYIEKCLFHVRAEELGITWMIEDSQWVISEPRPKT
jgi:hypothetical protein